LKKYKGLAEMLCVSVALTLSCSSFAYSRTAALLSLNEQSENEAARVDIVNYTLLQEIDGNKASKGKNFVVIATRWENIHKKQAVEKSRTEGKADRTMGVGGLAGKKSGDAAELVEMDVAYMIRKFEDHAYVLADEIF